MKTSQDLSEKMLEFTQSLVSGKISMSSPISTITTNSVMLQLQEMSVALENLDEGYSEGTILSKLKQMKTLSKYTKTDARSTYAGSFSTGNESTPRTKNNIISWNNSREDDLSDQSSYSVDQKVYV